MAKRSKNGEKFSEKYGVENFQVYKGDTDALKIPPPGHIFYDVTAPTTFDSLRTAQIDADGKMSTPIEIFSDPDSGTLWVIDGRGRLLDVREVNRRRKAEGRELVKPLIVPFYGTEQEAVARIRIKNYHRRSPTPSGMALDVVALRRAGWTWADCAQKLHVESKHPELWCRRLIPLAFCVEEVRAAIDSGELPRTAAPKFGGTKVDGSAALGKKEQLDLLAETRAERDAKKDIAKKPSGMTPKVRDRVREVLSNGASEKLSGDSALVARVVVATLSRIAGDEEALSSWPDVNAIVDEVVG